MEYKDKGNPAREARRGNARVYFVSFELTALPGIND